MSDSPFLGKVPKMDVIYMTRDQKPCERVSVCCQVPEGTEVPRNFERCAQCEEGATYICAYHGCPWPVEGKCPAKEKVGL